MQPEEEPNLHGPGAGRGYWQGDVQLQGICSDLSGGGREPESCSQKWLGSLRIQISQEVFSF